MTDNIFSLPESICIDGIYYTVNTDFRIWIRVGEIISSPEQNIFDKITSILSLCYKDTLPPSFKKAFEGILTFYQCGKVRKNNTLEKTKPVIDFIEDSDMISAAFLHDYNIDLWSASMHWWKFNALLSALSEDNRLLKIIGYRTININDIKDKEQKKFYRKMKSVYSLPDKRTQEEKESDMLEKLNSIFEEVQ